MNNQVINDYSTVLSCSSCNSHRVVVGATISISFNGDHSYEVVCKNCGNRDYHSEVSYHAAN